MSLLYFPAQASSSSDGGSLTYISKNTSSAATSSAFTSDIDSTYTSYIFQIQGIHFNTDSVQFQFQFSTDGGTSYGVEAVSFMYYGGRAATGSHTFFGNITGTYGLASATTYQTLGWSIASGGFYGPQRGSGRGPGISLRQKYGLPVVSISPSFIKIRLFWAHV